MADLTIIDYSGLSPSFPFEEISDYQRISLFVPMPQQVRNIARIIGACRSMDIVNFHHVGGYVPYMAPFMSADVVLSFWGSDALITHESRGRIHQALYRRSLARAKFVTCNSGPVWEKLGHVGGRLRRVDFPIETEVFVPPAGGDEVLKIRRRLGIPPGNLVILSSRALRPLYRVNEIIDMCRPALGAGDSTLVVHVPPHPDHGYLDQCRRAASGLPVLFSETDLDPGGLSELYRAADVMICAATSDSFPSSIVEALACGCAVVCTDDTPGYRALQSELPLTLTSLSPLPHQFLAGFRRAESGERDRSARSIAARFGHEAFAKKLEMLYLDRTG